MILLAADGIPLGQIATVVGVDRNTVRARLDRFRQERLPGLADRPRSGRPPLFTLAVILHLVRLACELPAQAGRSPNWPRRRPPMSRDPGHRRLA